MQRYILAISPDAKLLMQIQSHLQEGGRFSVVSASSGGQALELSVNQDFDLAILDAEISDVPFVPLSRELVARSPNIKLLVFAPQNNPRHPALTGLLANGFLSKPFFGPEVSEKISQALSDSNRSTAQIQSEAAEIARAWVQNPEIGAKQIEQILASTTALAGMLLLRGQVLANSGLLTQESNANIVNYLNRYWANIQSGELFRYLTMEHEASSYIIYAAPLIKDTAIALVYNSQKSIQEIRSEVTRLRKAFVEKYSTTSQLRSTFPSAVLPQDQGNSGEPAVPLRHRVSTNPLSGQPVAPPQPDETAFEEGLTEKEIQNLNQIISEMPAPDPELETPVFQEPAFSAGESWTPMEKLEGEEEGSSVMEPAKVWDTRPVSTPEEEIEEQPSVNPPEKSEGFPDFDFVLPWEKGSSANIEQEVPAFTDLPPLPVTEKEPFALGDTEPVHAIHPDILFPYTFLMFPADPGQFITRDLAALCNKNMPQLLSSFGWQMNAISVRPLYLQWSALIPPLCRISETVADIRLQLNTLFFTNHPALLQANPEGDFWLPGYFALSGVNPPSNRMINDFIVLYRQVEPQLH
jgi:DNA-binding response OmpR family regulator